MNLGKVVFFIVTFFLCSCGQYYKVSQSKDPEVKWVNAKKFYKEGKFLQAASLFETMLPELKGTNKADSCLYLLAQCDYQQKDYVSSSHYFRRYYTQYPAGEYAELSHYYCGMGFYLSSPEYELDQSSTTLKALKEFHLFMEYFPESERCEEVQRLIDEMDDKLAFKSYKSAELYYNLGNYLGNNYASCIVTAKNTLNDYPFTKHREELFMLILRARYKEAYHSVPEKQQERYRGVIDEFYNYRSEYPEGKYLKEATQYYNTAQAFTRSDKSELGRRILKGKKDKNIIQ